MRRLAGEARLAGGDRTAVRATAVRLVESVRRERAAKSGLDAFLRQYDLSSQEGVILMCLAEALLRIPDDDTADRLIADKIRAGDWESHLGDSESLFVNASTWGLLLTGRMVSTRRRLSAAPGRSVLALVTPARRTDRAHRDAPGHAHHGSPVRHGAHHRGSARATRSSGENKRYRYSFDMLGEAALTAPDADRYFESYRDCDRLGRARATRHADRSGAPASRSSCRRCIRASSARTAARPAELARASSNCAGGARRRHGADGRCGGGGAARDVARAARGRLPRARLAGWTGFGLAVQAYQKRAPAVIDWLDALARGHAAAPARAPGQGRVLGQRDQARPGAWAAGLSGLHAQDATPTSRTSPARACCSSRRADSIRSSRRTMRTRSRPCAQLGRQVDAQFRVPAPARHGRGALRAGRRRATGSSRRAACMRRLASTRTCCHTSCGACSRTAPTRRS